MAWVGQALIATRKGHHTDSRMLFEHAVTLSADVVSQQEKTPCAHFNHR
jgi:superkiller protein 3